MPGLPIRGEQRHINNHVSEKNKVGWHSFGFNKALFTCYRIAWL